MRVDATPPRFGAGGAEKNTVLVFGFWFWFFLVAVSAAVGRFAAHHFPTASAISDSLAILASRLSCALVLIVLKNLLCFSPVRFTSAVNFPLGFFTAVPYENSSSVS
jgi:hypothetical protein